MALVASSVLFRVFTLATCVKYLTAPLHNRVRDPLHSMSQPAGRARAQTRSRFRVFRLQDCDGQNLSGFARRGVSLDRSDHTVI